jgi:hypothetical protein
MVGPNTSNAAEGVDGGYTYTDLAAPAVLPAGKYRVTQACTKGMPDNWPDTNSNAQFVDPRAGAMLGDGYYSAGGGFPSSHSPAPAAGRWAGIATFKADLPADLHPKSVPACICSKPADPFGQGKGTLRYLPTGETIGFPPRCEAFPRESILRDHNPTCDIRTYVGGLSTCHHAWHLLDADQEVPWQDQPLEYYLKYRLYFQEYNASFHKSAYDWTYGIGGATGEYDVPQCPPGTPVEKCTHEITGTVVPPGDNMHFVAAHFHCHAPTCLAMEIYNNNTGELLCREEAYHGKGSPEDKYDEEGYIAQRICLWGNPPFDKPPLVSGVPLLTRAITNSTYGHHGEMALPQMIVANYNGQL